MAGRNTRKRKTEVRRTKFSNSDKRESGPAVEKPWWKRRRYILGILAGLFLIYTIYLDFVIRNSFEGKRWALPAQVYARPLELYPGQKLSARQFAQELELLGYRYAYQPAEPGSFSRQEAHFYLVTRPFQFWDGREASRHLEIAFENNLIESLKDGKTGKSIALARMEPPRIGGIYPAHHEDRILIKLDQAPELLTRALISVEDRNFNTHFGLDMRAIVRALVANVKGGSLQGGSTLTQQLVKNFFLSNERTLWRKANEALMALLLEWHYSKAEILEAYLNEVYLGQDKGRSIHGFGLASHFYFDKPVERLELAEVAALVAMIRGPGYYHPVRHTERLLQRRNLVLDLMAQQGVITLVQAQSAKQTALGVIEGRKGTSSYPAFMELVRRQLKQDYREKDLTSEGLRIFTSLDPRIQSEVEASVSELVTRMDRQRNLHETLQTAVLITSTNNGEVLAMVGDRNARYPGFNRVLDAKRPIGSLVKPAVYLTALQQHERYNLMTKLKDESISLKGGDGKIWSPKNYDGSTHGDVPLYEALVHSYNLATVRLGMELGFEPIAANIEKLGVDERIPPYPSMLLGAVELSPMQVAQMYQAYASGGFKTPLRAIREVLTVEGKPLQRYSIQVEQVVDSVSIQLLNSALQEVMRSGTGRSVSRHFSDKRVLAGKTGTTDELRDSWFAGFGSDYLGIVWLGTDENKPTGLTGSSGALVIWGDIMQRLDVQSLLPYAGDQVENLPIDIKSGLVGNEDCKEVVFLAFLKGTAPKRYAECAGGGERH
ncbi:MAG: penicillin-binding protein 1B [Gammaproteobacteria bacterium]|nr:penicillin-binding protein 1B [Gammaproteobacteria bacterium]MDH5652790.1 penicillin-binding protein 1B [Gammaproteobacteria bacterium]